MRSAAAPKARKRVALAAGAGRTPAGGIKRREPHGTARQVELGKDIAGILHEVERPRRGLFAFGRLMTSHVAAEALTFSRHSRQAAISLAPSRSISSKGRPPNFPKTTSST